MLTTKPANPAPAAQGSLAWAINTHAFSIASHIHIPQAAAAHTTAAAAAAALGIGIYIYSTL